MVGVTYHDQTMFFGLKNYHGQQKTVYANSTYQTIIGDTNHQLSLGRELFV